MSTETIHTDKALFDRIATGDEQAFTDIYLRYTKKLYPHVAKLLDSDSFAEEIIQETFAKLWAIRHTLTEIDNPNAFLYKMVSNYTLDYLKHKSVKVKAQYKIVRQAEKWGRIDTELEHDFKNAQAMFKEAIAQLSQQKQKIFRMKHELGMTREQIAAELNISQNTVRNHLAEALQFVREYMLDKGIFLLIWWIKNIF